MFLFGYGAKKDRGMGFWVVQEMKQEPFFTWSLTLIPRFLLLNGAETLAMQAIENLIFLSIWFIPVQIYVI